MQSETTKKLIAAPPPVRKNQVLKYAESWETEETTGFKTQFQRRINPNIIYPEVISDDLPINDKDYRHYSIGKAKKPRSSKRPSMPTVEGMEIGEYMVKEISGRKRRFVENARKTQFYFQRMQVAELACSILAMIGLFYAIMAYDIDFVSFTNGMMTTLALPKNLWTFVRTTSLYVVLITSIMQMICIIVRYKLKLKWLKSRKLVTEKYTLMNSREKVFICMEFILISLMPYPFFEDFHMNSFNEFENIQTTYSVNDILTMTIFLRVFYVLRMVLMHTTYYDNSAHRLFLFTKSHCSYPFVVRCLMKQYPFQILMIVFSILLFFFSYLLKISERPLNYAILVRERKMDSDFFILYDLSDYMNCLWLLIITMTTVGYGDYTPKTISGRSIIVAACFFGVMTVSLIVILFQDLFKLTTSEARALSVVQNMIYHKKKRRPAGEIITSLGRLGFFTGRSLSTDEKVAGKKQICLIKQNLIRLQLINENYKDSNHNNFYNEELSRRILFIKEDLDEIEKKLNIVIERCLNMLDDGDLDLI